MAAAARLPQDALPWTIHSIDVCEGSGWRQENLDLSDYNLTPVFCGISWALPPGIRRLRLALELPQYIYKIRLRIRIQILNTAGGWAYPTNEVRELTSALPIELSLFGKLKHVESLAAHNNRVQIRTLFRVEHFSFSLTANQLLHDAEIPVTGRKLVREEVAKCGPAPVHTTDAATQTESQIKPMKSLENLRDELTDLIGRLQLAQNREDVLCCVCLESDKDRRLQCGHLVCAQCAAGVTECPICRVAITKPLLPVFI